MFISVMLAILGAGASALFLSDPPPPPACIDTHGYYYWEQGYGFYTTLGGQTLEILNLTLTSDPTYGTIFHGDLYNGLGFKQGIIWWNRGGLRDTGLVILNDNSVHELDIIQLPYGIPRSHCFVNPFN